MTHRYNGYKLDSLGFAQWLCTCGGTSAIRYQTVGEAKEAYIWHQLAGQVECDLCTATTDEVTSTPDFGDLCTECYQSTVPRAELIADDYTNRMD